MVIKRWACDRCKTEYGEDGGESTITFLVDRSVNGAGSMENDFESVDLCFLCIAFLLRNAPKILGVDVYEGGRKLIAAARKK